MCSNNNKGSKELKHEYIDLKGFTKQQALLILEKQLKQTQAALNSGEIKPNEKQIHVFVIIAHRGNHSEGGVGVLKEAVKEYLQREYP
jgi:DNA-nicking Smr family endonuclease